MHPLGLLSNGEKAEIINIIKPAFSKTKNHILESFIRLDEMGVRAGNIIEMLNCGNDSTVLIKIDNSRLALSRSMAMKIYVRKQ